MKALEEEESRVIKGLVEESRVIKGLEEESRVIKGLAVKDEREVEL